MLNNQTIRFFINEYNEETEDTLLEVSEQAFLNAVGEISYERHTVSENGVSQICLTEGFTC